MNRADLIEKYEPRGRRVAGVLVFDPIDARDLVREAQELGINVLGLDGFLVQDDAIQPLQECDIDVHDSAEPHRAATEYLEKQMRGGVMYEVTLE